MGSAFEKAAPQRDGPMVQETISPRHPDVELGSGANKSATGNGMDISILMGIEKIYRICMEFHSMVWYILVVWHSNRIFIEFYTISINIPLKKKR